MTPSCFGGAVQTSASAADSAGEAGAEAAGWDAAADAYGSVEGAVLAPPVHAPSASPPAISRAGMRSLFFIVCVLLLRRRQGSSIRPTLAWYVRLVPTSRTFLRRPTAGMPIMTVRPVSDTSDPDTVEERA